ncbi:MAG: hypothetical protein IPO52_10370 [Gemmatimonadetes bacterium]|nr:hypothetical protein [Gemmatimonadota bacterium]
MPLTTRATFRINLILALLGAVVGALAAIPLTWVGKVLSGAPPADLANSLDTGRNGALDRCLPGRPSALSREPTIGALVGAALGMATGSEALFLLGTAAGLALPAWRLNRVYREVPRLDAATASEGLPLEP